MALSLVGTDFRRSQDQKGFTVGTVEKYKTEAHALKAEEGVRLMINDGMLRREQVLFCGILDRFLLHQKQAEDAEQITHNTLASYRSMIANISDPSGATTISKTLGPLWCRNGFASSSSRLSTQGHIRSLMYRLFDKAMLWELLNIESCGSACTPEGTARRSWIKEKTFLHSKL